MTAMILNNGLSVKQGGRDGYTFRKSPVLSSVNWKDEISTLDIFTNEELIIAETGWVDQPFIRTKNKLTGMTTVWYQKKIAEDKVQLWEGQLLSSNGDVTLVNGLPLGKKEGQAQLHPVGYIEKLPGDQAATGPLSPIGFLSQIQGSDIVLWKTAEFKDASGKVKVYYPQVTPGSKILSPGENKTFAGIRSDKLFDKLNFLSLMLALFGGTASLPHILIRYYTVKDESSARKSTIVGIATIGTFYILTLFMGLGAMTSGALDLTDTNMSAPLLARSLNETLFAIISAIAFTTVLGTVSGLILAAAGAVTHDLVSTFLNTEMTDAQSVRVAKFSSVIIGIMAITLGILFKSLNVNYLVGWAFSIAASANLPALIMILFWKHTTKQGVTASILVGMVSSLGWILLSQDTFTQVYKFSADVKAIVPFSQPGIVTIPLGFLTLIIVSLLTQAKQINQAKFNS
jgi:cation/acetate symporter